MSTHNFHNKCTLMRIRSKSNGVNGVNNSMKGAIGTNSHVSATKI